ncbi:MFS transporter [Streptomyces sp. V3I8]|uniref:MFS transporter n=1 Tax=Streptomyces sp. V3I8 TaxID=3042279 RepID=UPI0027D8983C|nr:MFS transporter [Streptomyces sp. V3I8]
MPTRTGGGGGAVRRIRVLVLLAALSALGPLSMDACMPGLPRLADSLHSPAWAVQLTVTACLMGLAVGQLAAGPLSDALGRRRPLLFGLTLYTVAGLLRALAPTVGLLVVLRGVQGLGGAFALVIAYAYVSDLHEGRAAALLGCGQFLFGGLAAPPAGLPGAHGAVPMATVTAVLGLAAVTVLITLTPDP